MKESRLARLRTRDGGGRFLTALPRREFLKLCLTLKDYHSTMGRMLARGMRAHLMADLSLEFLDQFTANLARGDKAYANPTEIPDGEFRGVGFHEAPRGSLSHWIVIKHRKIDNY